MNTSARLYLLGGIALRGVGGRPTDALLAHSKAVALLAWLILAEPGRRQRRDRLVGLLWPMLDQAHARTALRKAIHAARTVLGGEAIVSHGDEEVSLAPGALECDAAEFGVALEEGRLAHALELYRGDLMPGFHLPDCGEFQQWLDDERSSTLDRAAAASWAMALDCEGRHRLTDAGGWARVAARRAWTDERVLRRALVLLQRIGDRAGALELFDTFARRLRTEFDAAPSSETLALVASVRSS